MQNLDPPQPETLDPKTVPQTLESVSQNSELGFEQKFEIGDFVWAKKNQQWCPARICTPKQTDPKGENFGKSLIFVSFFGSSSSSGWYNVNEMKSFFDNFVALSSSSKSRSFLIAVNLAVIEFGKCLEAKMSCNCVSQVERSKLEKFACSGRQFINLPEKEFLSLVKDVSMDVCVVNYVESVRLKSWIVAFQKNLSLNQGHGRKKNLELVDKIDLNIASDGNSSGRRRKKSMYVVDDLNLNEARSGENAKKEGDNVEEEVCSGRRERKKSKYLSPPYTHLSSEVANNFMVSPRSLTIVKPHIVVDNEEMVGDLEDMNAVDIRELLSELIASAADHFYLKDNPLNKKVRGFFNSFRNCMFLKSKQNCPMDECTGGEDENSSVEVGDKLEVGKSSDCKIVNVEVGNKLEEGTTVAGKRGRKGKDVNNGDMSGEGKKTGENRGRKRKNKINDERIIPVNFTNFNNSLLGHSENKDEAANGKTPIMPIVETVTLSGNSGRKRGRKRTETTTNNVEFGNNNDRTIVNVPINGGIKKQKNNKNSAKKEDPAALLLTFLPETNLLSKDELFSKCCSYGPIIQSESEFLQEPGSAKIVFAKSSDAEKAFNDKVAAIGIQVAGYRLRYLTGNFSSSSSLTTPNQVPKPPLPYIRKSLERMISSIGGVMNPDMSGNLIGEMQGLLTKVDKFLTGPAAGTST